MSYLENPVFLLFLTLATYSFGVYLTGKKRWILFNPIILSMVILIGYLLVLRIPYVKYEEAGQYINVFLQPSIVALAIPLYTQWEKIKKQFFPIICSQLVGCVAGITSVVVLAKMLGAELDVIYSLAPKSVSTPIALEISKSINGIPSVTAAAVLLAGILGSMLGFRIMSLSGISNPMSQGISMGTASHAMGTMRAMEVSEKFGAFASVGMIFNGILTAILAPLFLKWMELLF